MINLLLFRDFLKLLFIMIFIIIATIIDLIKLIILEYSLHKIIALNIFQIIIKVSPDSM